MSETRAEERRERDMTQRQREEWDAVVIGSGLGGLACAAYLSAAGRRTLVLEAHYVAGGLLGPDLLNYRVIRVGDNALRVDVQRRFAHDQAVRAGIVDCFECGIFARITGWLDALDLAYELRPPLGECLKAQGRECSYTVTLADRKSLTSTTGDPPAMAGETRARGPKNQE